MSANDAFNRSIHTAARTLTEEHLRDGVSVPALIFLIERAVSLANDVQADIAGHDIAEMDAIACAKGCSWCCHLPVGVTAPFALAIAAHVREGRAAMTQEEARARLLHRLNEPSPAAFRPCAFLNDGLCAIYDIRPLACRGANSVDADLCRHLVERGDGDATPDRNWVHAVPYQAMAAMQDGLRAGFSAAGLSDDRLELTRAVSIAIEDPGAGDKWIAGEPVFVAARLG